MTVEQSILCIQCIQAVCVCVCVCCDLKPFEEFFGLKLFESIANENMMNSYNLSSEYDNQNVSSA